MARKNNTDRSTVVDEVGITPDTLTSRGGLTLYVRFLAGIGLMLLVERLFGGIRKSSKGQAVTEVVKQLLCFFMDGTSRHSSEFVLKEDPGYAAVIEMDPQRMQSSHAVKRFFEGFSWFRIWLFRRLLLKLFIWRLKLVQPVVVQLGMDTMVMDNDEAQKRHGVQPTYIWEEELRIGYVSSGKIYDDVKEYVTHRCQEHWRSYRNGGQIWQYLEMGSRREEWSKFRRAIFTRFVHGDDGQMLLDSARPTFTLYTNLGTGSVLDDRLKAAGFSHLLEPRGLIQCAHERGCDELIHRALKEF